jgi:hypothetical protein
VQIIAISLETAIQNGGIAFIVLSLTFPSPYSDMGLLPVLSFVFVSTGQYSASASSLSSTLSLSLRVSTRPLSPPCPQLCLFLYSSVYSLRPVLSLVFVSTGQYSASASTPSSACLYLCKSVFSLHLIPLLGCIQPPPPLCPTLCLCFYRSVPNTYTVCTLPVLSFVFFVQSVRSLRFFSNFNFVLVSSCQYSAFGFSPSFTLSLSQHTTEPAPPPVNFVQVSACQY